MGKIQAAMKKFSAAMVQPIMYLAVAGILMAIGVICQNLGGEGTARVLLMRSSSLARVAESVIPSLFSRGMGAPFCFMCGVRRRGG